MAGDVCLSVDIESVTSSFTASIKEFISSSSKAERSGPSLADVVSGLKRVVPSQVAVKTIYLTQTTGGAFYCLPRTVDGGWLVGGGRTVH